MKGTYWSDWSKGQLQIVKDFECHPKSFQIYSGANRVTEYFWGKSNQIIHKNSSSKKQYGSCDWNGDRLRAASPVWKPLI